MRFPPPPLRDRIALAFGRLAFALLLAAAPAWASGESGAAGQPTPQCLSAPTVVAAAPALAADGRGNCLVAWRETHRIRPLSWNGEPVDAIVVRHREGGSWRRTERLSPSDLTGPAAKRMRLFEPTLALDPTGKAHVAWVAAGEWTSRLEYRFQTARSWSPVAAYAVSRWAIEQPVLAVRPCAGSDAPSDFDVFFAWQERKGTNYRIHALVIDSSGAEHRFTLAENREDCRVIGYPQFLLLPPAAPGAAGRTVVCWFSESGSVLLEARLWDAAARQWVEVAMPNWNPSMLETLPLIVATPQIDPCLIFYESRERADRILLSSAAYPAALLDANPLAQNRSPRVGLSTGDTVGLVWREDTDSGSRLVQALLRPSAEIASQPLAEIDPFLQPHQTVAVSGESLLVAWIAPTSASTLASRAFSSNRQTPAVFFAETSFANQSWRPFVAVAESR